MRLKTFKKVGRLESPRIVLIKKSNLNEYNWD
jgi:hypothetical protein